MADNTLLNLSAQLGAAFKQRVWTLALAESCTGGMAAQYITAIPGSSAWFERGFITYSNVAKVEMLGVAEATLRQFGAVSEQTAREMAAGALRRSHARVAAAITGIAGPDGGTEEKPVGIVWFAWASKNGLPHSEMRRFSGDREAIRKQAVEAVFQGLIQLTLRTDL
jgi:nicotinamide-nucleotide amidase